MEEKIEKTPAPENAQKQVLSRREALKTLAAASGALAAAAFLPGKWAKPVVEAGVLPAHAQSSCSLIINGLDITPLQGPFALEASFFYVDSSGGVSDSTRLFAHLSPCGALSFNGHPLSSTPATRTGNGSNGKITFPFSSACAANSTNPTLSVQLANPRGCSSNTLSTVVPQI